MSVKVKHDLTHRFIMEIILTAILVFGIFIFYNGFMIIIFIIVQQYLIWWHNSTYAGWLGILYLLFIIYVQVWSDKKVIKSTATIYHEYKYSIQGKNIYVDYKDKDKMKVFNFSRYHFNPRYMELNNCIPVLYDKTIEYGGYLKVTEDVKDVGCYKDMAKEKFEYIEPKN